MFNRSSRYREIEFKVSITPDWFSSERDCYWNDLTMTADKHLLNNESEMCVGPTADSPLYYVLWPQEFSLSQVSEKVIMVIR